MGKILTFPEKDFPKKIIKAEDYIKKLKKSLKSIKTEDEKTKAQLLSRIGKIYYDMCDYQNALSFYREALKIYEMMKDKEQIATKYNAIGMILEAQGNYLTALENFRKAYEIYEAINDKEGLGDTYNNMGSCYDEMGNYTEALKHYQEALKIRKEIGDKLGVGGTLNNIGLIYFIWGEYQNALENFTKALQIMEELNKPTSICIIKDNIGRVLWSQEKYDDALQYYNEALKISEVMGHKSSIVSILDNIGQVFNSKRLYEKALKHYNSALNIAKEIKDKDAEGTILNHIGITERNLNNIDNAIKNHEAALKIAEDLNAIHDIAIYSQELGRDYTQLGKINEALVSYKRSLQYFQELFDMTPFEYKRKFRIQLNELKEVIENLNTTFEQTKIITPQLHESFSELINNFKNIITNAHSQDTKTYKLLESIADYLGKTLKPYFPPVPIFLQKSEKKGLVDTIKKYFKGKERVLYFVCWHCGKLHSSKIKEPGKFLVHLSKFTGAFQLMGYILPWSKGIMNIITEITNTGQTYTDLLKKLHETYLNFPLPDLQTPKKINLNQFLSNITKKPLSIDELQNFWDHLEDFNMILCTRCFHYVCPEHEGKECPKI